MSERQPLWYVSAQKNLMYQSAKIIINPYAKIVVNFIPQRLTLSAVDTVSLAWLLRMPDAFWLLVCVCVCVRVCACVLKMMLSYT